MKIRRLPFILLVVLAVACGWFMYAVGAGQISLGTPEPEPSAITNQPAPEPLAPEIVLDVHPPVEPNADSNPVIDDKKPEIDQPKDLLTVSIVLPARPKSVLSGEFTVWLGWHTEVHFCYRRGGRRVRKNFCAEGSHILGTEIQTIILEIKQCQKPVIGLFGDEKWGYDWILPISKATTDVVDGESTIIILPEVDQPQWQHEAAGIERTVLADAHPIEVGGGTTTMGETVYPGEILRSFKNSGFNIELVISDFSFGGYVYPPVITPPRQSGDSVKLEYSFPTRIHVKVDWPYQQAEKLEVKATHRESGVWCKTKLADSQANLWVPDGEVEVELWFELDSEYMCIFGLKYSKEVRVVGGIVEVNFVIEEIPVPISWSGATQELDIYAERDNDFKYCGWWWDRRIEYLLLRPGKNWLMATRVLEFVEVEIPAKLDKDYCLKLPKFGKRLKSQDVSFEIDRSLIGADAKLSEVRLRWVLKTDVPELDMSGDFVGRGDIVSPTDRFKLSVPAGKNLVIHGEATVLQGEKEVTYAIKPEVVSASNVESDPAIRLQLTQAIPLRCKHRSVQVLDVSSVQGVALPLDEFIPIDVHALRYAYLQIDAAVRTVEITSEMKEFVVPEDIFEKFGIPQKRN